MELQVLESSKKRLKLKVIGSGHTFCNVLVDELWNDKDVEVAAYNIKHPLVGVPELIVETKSGEPKKALHEAVKRLKKTNETAKKGFLKALK